MSIDDRLKSALSARETPLPGEQIDAWNAIVGRARRGTVRRRAGVALAAAAALVIGIGGTAAVTLHEEHSAVVPAGPVPTTPGPPGPSQHTSPKAYYALDGVWVAHDVTRELVRGALRRAGFPTTYPFVREIPRHGAMIEVRFDQGGEAHIGLYATSDDSVDPIVADTVGGTMRDGSEAVIARGSQARISWRLQDGRLTFRFLHGSDRRERKVPNTAVWAALWTSAPLHRSHRY